MERRHIWKGGREIYDPKGKHCGAQLWVGGSQGPAVFMRVMITQYHKTKTYRHLEIDTTTTNKLKNF